MTKERIEGSRTDNPPEPSFSASVLLPEGAWNAEAYRTSLSELWGIDASVDAAGELSACADGLRIRVRFCGRRLTDEGMMRSMRENYRWSGADDAVEAHAAYLRIEVDGEGDTLDRAKLLAKAVDSALCSTSALAVYADDFLYRPETYRRFTDLLRFDEQALDIWISYGVYRGAKQTVVYSSGLRRLKKHEIELIASPSREDDVELVRRAESLLRQVAQYVISSDRILEQGQVLQMPMGLHLEIEVGPGIIVPGDSVKIRY